MSKVNELVSIIPFGEENAITRRELKARMNLDDRAVRELIAEARREVVIINLQCGKGYFRPTEDEINLVKRYVKQEESRLKSIGWSLKAARRALKVVS